MTVGGVKLDVCKDGCAGIWFNAFELKKFDEPNEFAGDELLEMKPAPGVVVDQTQRYKCPECADHPVMMRHFESVKRGVTVDECPECGGDWLDPGELRNVRDEFPTEEARAQAAQAYFDEVFGGQLAAEKAKSDEQLAKAHKVRQPLPLHLPELLHPRASSSGARSKEHPMTTFVALLRAVNVGGIKVPMADLRLLLEGLGLRNVRTYLQSGNTVFDVEDDARSGAAQRTGRPRRRSWPPPSRRGSSRDMGPRVGALVLEAGALAAVAAANPLAGAAGAQTGVDPAGLHVTFLFGGTGEADFGPAPMRRSAPPTRQRTQAHFAGRRRRAGRVRRPAGGADTVVYLYLPHGYGRTKLNNSYFERHLGAAATTRNWRTVQALVAMGAG